MFSRVATIDEEALHRCARCGQRLAAGESVIELAKSNARVRFVTERFIHVRCAIAVSSLDVWSLLSRDTLPEDKDGALVRLTYESVGVRGQFADQRRRRFPMDLRDPIEQVRDPWGRPRYRVLLHCELLSKAFLGDGFPVGVGGLAPGDGRMQTTIVTRAAEYVLLGNHAGITEWIQEPGQPCVAAVVLRWRHETSLKSCSELWVNLELPPPVLWVVDGPLFAINSDRVLLALREAVDASGYRGDECFAFASPSISEESLAELGALLDQTVLQKVWDSTDPDAAERATHVFERQVMLDNSRAIAKCHALVRAAFDRLDDGQRARLAVAATAAFKFEKTRPRVRKLVQDLAVKLPVDALMDELRKGLANPFATVGGRFAMVACALMYAGHRKSVAALLQDTVDHRAPNGKTRALLQRLIAHSRTLRGE